MFKSPYLAVWVDFSFLPSHSLDLTTMTVMLIINEGKTDSGGPECLIRNRTGPLIGRYRLAVNPSFAFKPGETCALHCAKSSISCPPRVVLAYLAPCHWVWVNMIALCRPKPCCHCGVRSHSIPFTSCSRVSEISKAALLRVRVRVSPPEQLTGTGSGSRQEIPRLCE